MSRTIHLCEGYILCNPEKEHYSSSLTITDGLVCAINQLPPADSTIIDLKGRFAIPSFTDSHLHLVEGASVYGGLDLRTAHSRIDFFSCVQDACSIASDGEWVVGSGWSETRLGGMPDCSWFDQNVDVPVICYRKDMHCAAVNDALLSKVDVNQIMKLVGGEHIQDGIVKEDALFQGINPLIPTLDDTDKISRVRNTIRKLHSHGITLVGSMECARDVDNVLLPISSSRLIRICVMNLDQPTKDALSWCEQYQDDDFLKVIGFKSFLDGSLGSRTAKMYDQWNDVDSDGLWIGIAATGELGTWVNTVASAGFAPVMHAIGDRAVGLALDALESVHTELIPRIEHAQFISKQDISKISGKWFGVQPLHQPDDSSIAKDAVGVERAALLHNWRRMLNHGATLSFGSDWPVADHDPIAAMAVAIEQGLSTTEALVSSTLHAAQSLQMPNSGRLEIGCLGDVAILDKDIHNCDWKVSPPSVTMTVLDGEIVFEREVSIE